MSLNAIKHQGDVLEQRMFSDGQFAAAFGEYASVWAKHILPRRTAGGGVHSNWLQFAMHNYTAIVRCWNARTLRESIHATAGREVGATQLLDLHRDLVGFFAMSRAAIENLHGCFVCRGLAGEKDWKHVSAHGDDYPNIGWIRLPRNELLHNRLLPIHPQSTPVTVDRSLMPTNDQDCDKPWYSGSGDHLPVATMVDEVWAVFPDQMNSLWRTLAGELEKDAPAYGLGAGSPIGHGGLSGVPEQTEEPNIGGISGFL